MDRTDTQSEQYKQSLLNENGTCEKKQFNPATQQKGFKPATQRLHDDIRAEHARLIGIKKKGRQVFSEEYIIDEIAYKFYKAPKTIEDIVYGRTSLKKPKSHTRHLVTEVTD